MLGLPVRAIKILYRYGFTKRRLQDCVQEYVNLMRRYNCNPTFLITANILRRNPALIQKFAGNGVEFAIHGYVHQDYTKFSTEDQIKHIEKAVKTFQTLNIPFAGFRAPYLKWNDEILKVISHFNFSWDSSKTVIWNSFNQNGISSNKWKAYQKMLAYCRSLNAQDCILRPTFQYNFVEIPVSLPDDVIIIDIFGITKRHIIENIWLKILNEIYERGEIFTLQLHPERFFLCKSALDSVLHRATNLNPSVWITQLREITNWWKERKAFKFEIYEVQQNKYRIKAKCSKRATILTKNLRCNTEKEKDFINGYNVVDTKDFVIESSNKPVIGISRKSSMALFDFLREEGYSVEISDNKDEYEIYFENVSNFAQKDAREILNTINNSSSPLVRYWRWPDKAKSALAITGDIDAITSTDFIIRAFGK